MLDELSDIYKILLVGDAGTGKTHILYCFSKEKVPANIMPTIALQYTSKIVTLDNQRVVRTQIWDTSGQQQYRALTMNHYRKAVGALIVFDVANKKSFQHVNEWLSALLDKAESNVQVGLVGHKVDQLRREVTRQEAQDFATKFNLFYVETTVKDPYSIRSAFKRLLNNVTIIKRREVTGIKLNSRQLLRENEDGSCLC